MNTIQFQEPPRHVPLSLVLRIAFDRVFSTIGWIFFGVGMMLFLLMGLDSDLFTFHRFIGPLEKVQGKVIKTTYTDWEVNEQSVVKWLYVFDYQGKKYVGASYALEQIAAPEQPVTVEFAAQSPEYSRVEGLREAMTPWWVSLIVMIFPAIGLLFIGLSVMHVPQTVNLLRNGMLAYGTYVDKEATNMTINNMPVYNLRFQFEDLQGKPHYVYVNSYVTDQLLDEPQEALIYHPRNPEKAVVLDELPGQLRLNEQGQWESTSSGYAFLVVPVLAITINVIIAFFKL